MRLLPSQQKVAADEAANMLVTLPEGAYMRLDEPCNCNGQIRHNNGGNYHEMIEIARDEGKLFVRYGSTSEFTDPEWVEETTEKAIELTRARAADGYSFYVA